jgi:N-methylhydantoinase A
VPVPDGPVTDDAMAEVVAAFEKRYEQLFGKVSAFAAAGVEWMNFRVQAYGIRPKPGIKQQPVTPGTPAQPNRHRKVYWYEERAARDTAIFTPDTIVPGAVVEGPAVIELPTTTVAVRPGQRLDVDGFGNYVITVS